MEKDLSLILSHQIKSQLTQFYEFLINYLNDMFLPVCVLCSVFCLCSYLSVLIRGWVPIVLDGSNHTRASLTPILMHNMLNLISILMHNISTNAQHLTPILMHNMLNLNWIKRKPEEEALQMERRELHHVSLFH